MASTQRSDSQQKLKQGGSKGSRVEKRGERRSLERSGGICASFEVESDTGSTRPKGFQEE